ncbi:unnamed protein product, partial [Adineta steineri]
KSSEKKKTSSEEKIPSNNTEDEINRVERLHREQMRSKWESDMDALRNKTHVHYQDILFDEKREHGIGFYKFSTDDKQRAEQMATLNDLRTNTKNEQMKFSQEKEKRTVNMSDRLNKIRLRKAKEMGINLSGDNKDKSEIKTTQEILEQVPIVKNDEKDKQKNLPEITIQTTQVQSSKQNVNDFFIHVIVLILPHGLLGIKLSLQQLAKNKTTYFHQSFLNIFCFFRDQ